MALMMYNFALRGDNNTIANTKYYTQGKMGFPLHLYALTGMLLSPFFIEI